MTVLQPTARQLTYLRALARRTGTTFTNPRTRAQAGAEIQRLKAIGSTGFTFAERPAEDEARRHNDDAPLNATAFRADEIGGYGPSCTWSQRA